MELKKSRFHSAISVLSHDMYAVLKNAPSVVTSTAQEIVLRADRPLCVECSDKRYYFTQSGCVTDTLFDSSMVVATKRSLFDTFQNICSYSVYSRQQEINSGFVTIKGGHRAGICGTAVKNNGDITNIKDITTINIRIAREIKGCSDELYKKVKPLGGILICGAPSSGKTTLIRDYARRLSYEYKVSLIDERSELASTVMGSFQNDVGMCDVFDGYIKSEAITQAVRSMSPDIIVCDEISTPADVSALTYGLNSGVAFVATMHADSLETLKKRAFAKEILKTEAFSQLVFLDTRHNAGHINSINNFNKYSGEFNA